MGLLPLCHKLILFKKLSFKPCIPAKVLRTESQTTIHYRKFPVTVI